MAVESLVERIMSRQCGAQCRAGDYVVARVDRVYITDASAPSVLDRMEQLGGDRPAHPDRIALVMDHYVPAPSPGVAEVHRRMRDFARRTGCHLSAEGGGICHQVLGEQGFIRPGELVVGADSHTVTYGAYGTLALGVGSTDAAVAAVTGRLWFRVPDSARLRLRDALQAGCSGRDVALKLNGSMGPSGADYLCVELWTGEADIEPDHLSAVANASAEWGAKAAVSVREEDAASFEGATYAAEWDVDLASVEPFIALPHSPHRTVPVREVRGRPVQLCFVGTCAGGTLGDLRGAANVLRDAKVAPDTRLLVAPASRGIYARALREGLIDVLHAAGAVILPAGCGPCCGTANGVPAAGETVISTACRNYRGRMGNAEAEIYLASAETVAAAAASGCIEDPREVWYG